MDTNPQDLLWALPNLMGHGWWYMCSGLAAAALLTIFLYMIMNERFSSLLVARAMLAASMLCFALVPLNSGWIPWGVLLACTGSLYTAFLIATDWCHRHDKWQTVWNILTGRKRAPDAQRHYHSD